MRTPAYLTLAVLAALSLSGCGRSGFSNRGAPDEMAVTRKAPLVIPPEFALTPPAPGTADSQNTDLQRQALDGLFGGPAPRSPRETSTLGAAGRASGAAGVRSNGGAPE